LNRIAAVYAAVGVAPSAEGEKAAIAKHSAADIAAAEEQEEPAAVFVRSNDVDAFAAYYRAQNAKTSEPSTDAWDVALAASRQDRDLFSY
jgi:hypothetical protein